MEYTDDETGLKIRPVLLEDIPVEEESGEEVIQDIYIWFACDVDDDSWFAFALSDTCDDPEGVVGDRDLNEIKRMSVWLGAPWDELARNCPHCVAERQRMQFQEMSVEVYKGVMDFSLDELRRLKKQGQWEGQRMLIEGMTGVKMSLN